MKSALISTSNGSPISNGYESSSEPTSIHSGIINEVYDIPMKEITRPFLPALNENKVQSFMTTIQTANSNRIPPIDVLWYQAPNSRNNYFFSMSGCHRWEAHQRLNLPTIRAKLIRTTLNDLKVYFGSSLSDLQ